MPIAAALPAPVYPSPVADPRVPPLGRQLREKPPSHLCPRGHQPARRQAGDGLQPAAAPLRETGHANFAGYLDALERLCGPAADAEWQDFINCLTTNLTSFFREDHHFDALRDDVLARRGKPLRIWCAAASTGEEPYSIATTVAETLGPAASQVPVLCTDIDTKVLATARRHVYGSEAMGLSPARLRQHFMRGTGANAGFMRVRPELARPVEFRPFNLMSPQWSTLGEPFDVVFCRNVMIHFDNPTQRRVLERTRAVMKPGGLRFVGHAENFAAPRDLFRLLGKTIYERV